MPPLTSILPASLETLWTMLMTSYRIEIHTPATIHCRRPILQLRIRNRNSSTSLSSSSSYRRSSHRRSSYPRDRGILRRTYKLQELGRLLEKAMNAIEVTGIVRHLRLNRPHNHHHHKHHHHQRQTSYRRQFYPLHSHRISTLAE